MAPQTPQPVAHRQMDPQMPQPVAHVQTPPTRPAQILEQTDGKSASQQDMDLAAVGENGKLSSSPPGSYTRIPPRPIDSTAVPPILPPHLLQVILNNPDKANTTILPQPNHVMLNHLYALSIKDGIMVLSSTQRFRKKYVTTLLYKPI